MFGMKSSNGNSSSRMKSLHDVNKMYAEENAGNTAAATPQISSNLIGYVDLSDIKTNQYNYYGSDIPSQKKLHTLTTTNLLTAVTRKISLSNTVILIW